MNTLNPPVGKDNEIDILFQKASFYVDEARNRVQRSINFEMVQAYWFIGRDIITAEQKGQASASYGSQLLQELSTRLTQKYGKGFSVSTLRDIRQFYLIYHDVEIHHAVRGKFPSELALSSNLGWIH